MFNIVFARNFRLAWCLLQIMLDVLEQKKIQLKICKDWNDAVAHSLLYNVTDSLVWLPIFCSLRARKLIPSVAAATAADRDSDCAGIQIAAKIPIGNCFSSHYMNSTLRWNLFKWIMFEVQTVNAIPTSNARYTHISNPLAVRQCVKSRSTTDHAIGSTHAKRKL